jgi:hypothetical protein
MSKRKIPSLVIEHVSDTGNLRLLSMLEHRRDRYLVIVDNISDDAITAYVLDYAQQEGVDLRTFIQLAEDWLATSNGEYPLSFELSKMGLTNIAKRIYKTFDLAYVTRLVGQPFSYDLQTPLRVRRRRANKVPAGIEIRPKQITRP